MQQQVQQQQDNDPLCLSFSSYSTDKLADVAVRVTQEITINDVVDDDVEQFEFAPSTKTESVFGSVFPLFNRDIVSEQDDDVTPTSPVRQPLGKLFSDDRFNDSSSDEETEIEELDGIAPGTYCVWAPKSPSTDLCKKSNSTGNSSKRWRFLRDLLKRSHSDGGKESFELVNSKTDKFNDSAKRRSSIDNFNLNNKSKAKAKAKYSNSNSNSNSSTTISPSSPIQAFYKSTREMDDKQKNKRKSFLPYRTFLASFPI